MENLTNWCVYMHENRANGKKYIGITSQKPTRRWANGHGYIRCPIFYAAIQKYGWDAFRHELLFTDLTQEEAERLETELIAKYQTRDREKGYNLAAGGETNAGFHRSDEFKQKLSASKMGHPVSEAQRRAHGEKMRGRHKGAKNPFARAVVCIDTGVQFATLTEAAGFAGVSPSGITFCCRGRTKTAGGYRWKYAEAVSADA